MCTSLHVTSRHVTSRHSSVSPSTPRLVAVPKTSRKQLSQPSHRARRGMNGADDDDDDDGDDDDVHRLNALLREWREPLITRVLPRLVIPDGTNRAATGVSLEHAHGIAQNIAQRGFDVDHDVPVVVRENVREMLRSEAYARWERFTRANAAVLPATSAKVWDGEPWAFLTLGSSHLNLALKLIEHDVPSVFSKTVSYGSALGRDKRLRDAVYDGLPSVVLRPSTPADVRERYPSRSIELKTSVFASTTTDERFVCETQMSKSSPCTKHCRERSIARN